MHYLDPSRRRISGLPAMNGAHMSIIPGLYIAPRGTPENPEVEISGFFSNASNRSSRLVITMPPDKVQDFLERWFADPEHIARTEFKWNPEPERPPATPAHTTAPTPDLDFDLGDILEDLECAFVKL